MISFPILLSDPSPSHQYLLLSPRIISDILSQVVSCHGNGHWVLRLTQYRNQQPQNLMTILVQFHHVLTLERNVEFTSVVYRITTICLVHTPGM